MAEELTKENLQNKINILQKEKEQLIAKANGCSGAIQAYQEIIDIIEKQNKEKEVK